jgi:hypothetical protein
MKMCDAKEMERRMEWRVGTGRDDDLLRLQAWPRTFLRNSFLQPASNNDHLYRVPSIAFLRVVDTINPFHYVFFCFA